MPAGLFREEAAQSVADLPVVQNVAPGMFDQFATGVGKAYMSAQAKTARGAAMLAGAVPVLAESLYGGGSTEIQDRYFKALDETFQSAVDYWAPNANEVGSAGLVVGQLAGSLPLMFASPQALVASVTEGSAEDLVREGASPARAIAVGAIQGAATATGLWAPIFGGNAWQRILVGGAAFNAAQGLVSRGASSLVLDNGPGSENFAGFDWQQLTLDVLMGAAFGTLAHLSPAQREASGAAWDRVKSWAQGLQPSDVDALAVLREAQHLNEDSLPGKPQGPVDVEAHVQAARVAMEQLLRDQPVQIETLPQGHFAPDEVRLRESAQSAEALRAVANDMVTEATGQKIISPQDTPTELPPPSPAEPARLVTEHANVLGSILTGRDDPLSMAAAKAADDHPEVRIPVYDADGQAVLNADGQPLTHTIAESVARAQADVAQAHEVAPLFKVAATCLLGG